MKSLNIEQIQKILPHRYPMLLIDKVIESEPGKQIIAIKNVTINEAFFQGHFPQRAVMPGVLIIEAMAQASILIYYERYKDELKATPEFYLGSVKASFTHPVFPGDQIKFEAEAVKLLPTSGFITVKAFVDEKQVAEADLVFAIKR